MRALVLATLLCLVAACGGTSSSDVSTVTKNDLAIMVLPATELGELADGLEVDPDSGFQDAAAVAEDTIDPNDTEQDIESSGLRADYQLTYMSGDMQVNSEVALFGSAEEASEFVAATVGDAEKYEGTDIESGATLTSVDIAEVDEPGDSAWEGTATAAIGDLEGSTSVVAFTIDNVAGSVSVTRVGDPVSTADVQELAQKLATRIEAVAGERDLGDACSGAGRDDDPRRARGTRRSSAWCSLSPTCPKASRSRRTGS